MCYSQRLVLDRLPNEARLFSLAFAPDDRTLLLHTTKWTEPTGGAASRQGATYDVLLWDYRDDQLLPAWRIWSRRDRRSLDNVQITALAMSPLAAPGSKKAVR